MIEVTTIDGLPEGQPGAVAVHDKRLVLVNLGDGRISALDDCCSHMGALLSVGTVNLAEGTIACPWHHSLFDLESGAPIRGPARDPVRVYRVHVDGRRVLLDVPGPDEPE